MNEIACKTQFGYKKKETFTREFSSLMKSYTTLKTNEINIPPSAGTSNSAPSSINSTKRFTFPSEAATWTAFKPVN